MFISRPLSEGTARMNLAISSAAFPAISVRGVLACRMEHKRMNELKAVLISGIGGTVLCSW